MAAHFQHKRTRVKKLRGWGFTLEAIANEVGETVEFVREALRNPSPPKKKRPPSALRYETQEYEREVQAVAELRAEGYPDAVIRASFPNIE